MNVRKTILLILILIKVLVASSIVHAEEDNSTLRKKLFLLERRLEKVSEEYAREHALKLDVNAPLPTKEEMHAAVDAVSLEVTDEDGQEGESVEDKKKDFGSVTAVLKGGALTSFSYAGQGLDLSDTMDGKNLVLLLESTEVDVSDLASDESVNDKFLGANRESFYGLEEYKDMQNLFEKQAPGKDYTMMGMGLTMDLGGYELGMLNYSKPPERRKKIFFGNQSAGPYPLGNTNIIPGSLEVRINGATLSPTTDYDVDYGVGEITFVSPVGLDTRVYVEYELADSSGGAPGKFTGFRFSSKIPDESGGEEQSQTEPGEAVSEKDAPTEDKAAATPDSKPNKFALTEWGASYFMDQVIDYRSVDGEVTRNTSDHTLVGFDGAMQFGAGTEVAFEYAQSRGDKSRALGRFASATFTIADSSASDGDTTGPYYLASDTLPIIEETDEVRLNGELLTRDEDYRIDPTYGHLRIINDAIDLTDVDELNITYRYLTEADRQNAGGGLQADSAHKIRISNEFGKFRHTFEQSRFGEQYLQVGRRPTGNLLDRSQEFAWTPREGLDISHTRTLNQTLRDSASGLRESNETSATTLNFKRGNLSAGFDTDTARRYDNQPQASGNTTRNTNWNLDYAPGDKYNLGWKHAQRRNENNGANDSTERDTKDTLNFAFKPMKELTMDATFIMGDTQQAGAASLTAKKQDSRTYKLNYKPSKKFNFSYDLSANTFRMDAPGAATSTADTGSRNEKINLTLRPTDALQLTLRTNNERETHHTGGRNTRRNNYGLKYKIGPDANLDYTRNTMTSDRSNQAQDTVMQNLSLSFKLKLLPRGVDAKYKLSRQNSDVVTIGDTTTTASSISTRTNTITLSAQPFWENKIIKFQYQNKTGGNQTNDTLTPQRDRKLTVGVELPFIGDSGLSVEQTNQRRAGTRILDQRDLSVTLTGSISDLFELQFSYTSQCQNDLENPEASNSSSDLTAALKGNFEF